MSNFKFYNYPLGAKITNIDAAPLADPRTSIELVRDGQDAFYFRRLEAKGIKLNEPQISAVRHREGPALVLAGAGSGKTSVLTARAGYLITVCGVSPKHILLMTFTSKAAQEMKARIAQQGITAGTFHSIFWRLLKSRGYSQKILSHEKQKQIAIKLILKQKGLQDTYEPETLLSLLSHYKNNLMFVQQLPAKTAMEKEIKAVLIDYEAWKTQHHYLDFDDMLLEAVHLLREQPELLKAMQHRFHYILCDEWQDTNPVQYELIKMIASPKDNLFVVGDDDQTIFSFNGADRSIIMNFDQDYPNRALYTLDVNYRSTDGILGLANHVIALNQERHPKTLKSTKPNGHKPLFARPNTTDDEALIVIDQIKDSVQSGKRRYQDFAILHRTLSSSRAMFEQLVIHDIPFVSYTKGNTFYEQGIVAPVIDYLRLSLDPGHLDAISGILPTLYLNREKAMVHIESEQILNESDRPLKHLLSMPDLKDFQKTQIAARLTLIKTLKNLPPLRAVKEIRTFYDRYLEANERNNITLHKEIIRETLSEIEASAKRFKTVEEFIVFIEQMIEKNKQMDALQQDGKTDCVSLMTIHRAKGLEFPVVHLIGASETVLPHSSALEADDREDLVVNKKGKQKVEAAIEEERRLAYVAITRAKEELYINSPSFYRGEKAAVSRFILDPYLPQEQHHKAAGHKETIVAWDCTNEQCKGWMRITTPKDRKLEKKPCPICQTVMVQREKEVN